MLGDGLFKGGLVVGSQQIRSFGFYYGEGDAIDKKGDVRPVGFGGSAPLYSIFGSNMKHIVPGIVPVDALHHKTFGIAFDVFLKAFAQGDQVVHLFAGGDQTVLQRKVFERLDGVLYVVVGKSILLTAIMDGIELS